MLSGNPVLISQVWLLAYLQFWFSVDYWWSLSSSRWYIILQRVENGNLGS